MKLITPYAASFGTPNVIIKHFPDTESYVLIPGLSSLKNQKVTIYHRLYPEPDKRIFELLLILSRIKQETLGRSLMGEAKHLELFIPSLPYARQDRENKVGEAVSADVLCGLLKNFGVKKLITYDCHFLPKPGNFKRAGLNIENHSAGKQLLSYAKKYFGKEKFLVIAPDEGASYFTENAEGHSLKKVRAESSARAGTRIHADIDAMHGDVPVHGKNVCILDDIISSGGTIIRAIEHLKSLGAKKIIVGATHGVFAGDKIAEKILQSGCDHIFVMNTIPQREKSVVKMLEFKQG